MLPDPEEKKLVPEAYRLLCVAGAQADRNLLPHSLNAHLLADEACLQRGVLKRAASGDELWSEDVESGGVELLGRVLKPISGV